MVSPLRWVRTPRPAERSLIYIEIHAGRFHLQAQHPYSTPTIVAGETIDDLRFDIDYEDARKRTAKALRVLADRIENDSILIDAFTEEP